MATKDKRILPVMIRLNKFLASTGKFSRRGADELITAGKVKINGAVVDKLGTIIDPEKDQVFCFGKLVVAQPIKVYLALNKPAKCVSTKADPHGRATVMRYVPNDLGLFPVGRLDYDSDGLLLFTNDGDWAQKLLHPSFVKNKEYLIKVKEEINPEQLGALKKGVFLEEGIAKADAVKQVSTKELCLVIHQGWRRQVRRMAEEVGLTVEQLTRIRVGKLSLGSLPSGQWKLIKPQDV